MSKARYFLDQYTSQLGSESERYFIHRDQLDPRHSPVSLGEDKDVFFTGSTFYSVRVEQSANELSYSGNVGNSEIDDATLHMDDALEDEETTNLNADLNGMQSSDYRLQSLEMELEILRRENRDLRMLLESYKTSQSQRIHKGEADSGEEVLEEEVCTVQRNRPAVKKFDKSVQLDRTGVLNSGVEMYDTSRYHLLDMRSKIIEESHFPRDYWSRLEQVFKKRFAPTRPSTKDAASQSSVVTYRTAATMATPLADKERRCFGVSVRPLTREVGVLWHSGSPSSETDTAMRIWMNRQYPQLSDATRSTVTRLVRSSRQSREEFVKTILSVFRKDVKTVAAEAKPECRSQSTATEQSIVPELTPSVGVVSHRRSESQLIEARPVLENICTLTTPVIGTTVAVETDVCLLRSQGSQATPELPDVTCCGTQTDVGHQKTDRGTNPHLRRTHVQCTTHFSPISSQKVDSSYEMRTFAEPSGVQSEPTKRRFIPSVTKLLDSRLTDSLERTSSTTSSYSHTIQLHSSRPLSPMEVQQLFPTALQPPSNLQPDVAPNAETAQSAPNRTTNTSTSDNFSFLTERRLIEEKSRRRLLPGDVNVERLLRSGDEVVDNILSRSKPLSTTHETHKVNRDRSPTSLFTSTPFGQPSQSGVVREEDTFENTKSSFTVDKKVHNIPFVCTLPSVRKNFGTKPSDKFDTTVDTVTESRGHSSVSSAAVFPSYSTHKFTTLPATIHHPVQSTSSCSDLSMSPGQHPTTMDDTSSDVHATLSQPSTSLFTSSVSRRYILSADTKKICERLSKHYKLGHSPQTSIEMASELTKLSSIWFNLTSSVDIHMTQISDFLAILHGYSEELARDVIRSSNGQGATCLHLAVGHGALSVVELILDSGYAEPDRLNGAGYSPVMIAAMSPLVTVPALSTLNRLFSMGNVNLRSSSGSLQTPLMIAAQNGSLEVLHLLLQHSASVNTQDSTGNTALMFAIQRDSRDIIGALLDRPDLDLSLKDNNGDDALAIAMRQNDPVVIEWIQNVLKHGKRSSTGLGTPTPVFN